MRLKDFIAEITSSLKGLQDEPFKLIHIARQAYDMVIEATEAQCGHPNSCALDCLDVIVGMVRGYIEDGNQSVDATVGHGKTPFSYGSNNNTAYMSTVGPSAFRCVATSNHRTMKSKASSGLPDPNPYGNRKYDKGMKE